MEKNATLIAAPDWADETTEEEAPTETFDGWAVREGGEPPQSEPTSTEAEHIAADSPTTRTSKPTRRATFVRVASILSLVAAVVVVGTFALYAMKIFIQGTDHGKGRADKASHGKKAKGKPQVAIARSDSPRASSKPKTSPPPKRTIAVRRKKKKQSDKRRTARADVTNNEPAPTYEPPPQPQYEPAAAPAPPKPSELPYDDEAFRMEQ